MLDPYRATAEPIDADPCVPDTDPCVPADYTEYDSENDSWSAADCDNDGISNGDEFVAGTNPYEAATPAPIDADGDGVLSDVDTDDADPCVPAQSSDYTEYDSENDIWSAADCDNDGISNGDEFVAGTNPYEAATPAPIDADGDGVLSDVDTDDADPCVPAQASDYTEYRFGKRYLERC